MLVIFEFFWEAIVTAEQDLTRLQVLHRSLYNFSLTSINSHTNSGFTSLRDYLGDSLQKLRETEEMCNWHKLALFWHVRAAVRKIRKVDNKKCCRNEWQTIGFILLFQRKTENRPRPNFSWTQWIIYFLSFRILKRKSVTPARNKILTIKNF